MSKLDFIEYKLNPGYVSPIKTRNSRCEKKLFCISNNKVRRNLFCHLLSQVRTRRSQSVLPRRFSVLKSCLTLVPLFMLKKNAGQPHPEFPCWGCPNLHECYWGLGRLLPLRSTKIYYQQPMKRASNRLVAFGRPCRGIVALNQIECEERISSAL